MTKLSLEAIGSYGFTLFQGAGAGAGANIIQASGPFLEIFGPASSFLALYQIIMFFGVLRLIWTDE